MIEGIKYQIVEVQVDAGNTQPQFNFPPQPFLVGKKIVSIETYTVNDMTNSPVFGNTLPTSAQFLTLFLTLYGADPDAPSNAQPVATLGQQPAQGNWIRTVPLTSLHRLNNFVDPYAYELFEIVPRNIAWEQSNILCRAAGGLNPNANLSIVLLVGYTGIETTQAGT